MPEQTTIRLMDTPLAITEFACRNDRLWLTRLCGLPIGRHGADTGPAPTQGVALLQLDGRRCEGNGLVLNTVAESDRAVTCRWQVGDSGLRLTSAWSADAATGVVSRRDTLDNTGEAPVTFSCCLARIALPPGRYECYTQASRWCHENQGAWQPLHSGLRLSHPPGRTTEGATPYLAIRRIDTGNGLACHILPRGNWTIRVTPVTEGGEAPFAVIELGLADENLHRTLAPSEAFDLPEIIFQPIPHGKPHLAAPSLHQYLLRNHFAAAKPEAPVVFNTWFYEFEILDVPHLRQQLAAAREVGCEVFVIDAGWYGPGGTNWGTCVGDWREKTEKAFQGRMQQFADEVRAAGLGFGLWIEPERFGPEAPIRAEHPEYFVHFGDMARLDLTQPAAYVWLRDEIKRLVKTYQLAWMKLDFNFALDNDASGAELADYTAAWHRLLDEIRAACPETFFEGCSSGAMRGDLETLRHVDGHFLSDSVNPTDMLRITQGAWLRLPPGRLTRWTVVRSAGKVLPRYMQSVADSPVVVITPGGALWEPAESVDLDFALLAAMPGMFGLSGDIASLPPEHRGRVGAVVAFYKRWRRFITGAAGHLLTPPMPLECREGWIGLQLQDSNGDTSLVFVYRLGNAGAPPVLRLRGLDPACAYGLECGLDGEDTGLYLGKTLMCDGLPPHLLMLANHSAEVFVVKRKNQ